MQEILSVLQICPLFSGLDNAELKTLLDCLGAVRKRFEKASFVFAADEGADSVGIVLSGAVHILREDFWGRRIILSRAGAGELFGEAFSCADVSKLPVSAMVAEDSDILLIDCKRIFTSCSQACAFHSRLIKNLARILAEKSVALMQKLEHVTQRTTREKLLSYLSEQARLSGTNTFDVPFNRQEMADYLSVDRSAMSAELSRMRTENLLRCHRNHFELLQ